MQDWEKIQKRYEQFWSRENHDRPLVCITGPKNPKSVYKDKKERTLMERWCDIDYMLARTNHDIGNTYYGAEAYPMAFPDLGPDQFAAFYGTPLTFGETTSWAAHFLEEADTAEIGKLKIDRENFYYRKLREMTEAMTEDARGRYFVGIPDLHPGADALVSMRGPQQLCIDTLEDPDFITSKIMELYHGFCSIYDEMYQITTKYQTGSSNWMGIWHPKRWYVTSCDFCCMISPEMFEELIIPELMKELQFLDQSIFHLDGCEALKHLDRLLQIKELDGIQWVYGAGAPTASHWIETINKIQDAGKLVHIEVLPGELEFMLEHVKPEGVLLKINASSEAEARALEELVTRNGR